MRQISTHMENPFRIIGLSYPIANYRDVSDWLGASYNHSYNFYPNIRPLPLELYFRPFDQVSRKIRLQAMTKRLYQDIKLHSEGESVMVFVSDRK